MENYGLALKKLRIHFKYTQREVANRVGVSHHAVSKWENGVNQPDIHTLRSICEMYGVTIEQFFRISAGERIEDVLSVEKPSEGLAPTEFKIPDSKGAGMRSSWKWLWFLLGGLVVAALVLGIALLAKTTTGDPAGKDSEHTSVEQSSSLGGASDDSEDEDSQEDGQDLIVPPSLMPCVIEYYLDDQLLERIEVEFGETPPIKSTGKYGYVFQGWYTSPTGGEAADLIEVQTSQRVYAKFRPIKFTVVFQDEWSGESYTMRLDFEDKWNFPEAIFSRENYVLTGWDVGKGNIYPLGGAGIDLKAKDGETVYVNAFWAKASVIGEEYQVYYNGGDGVWGAMPYQTEHKGTPWTVPDCGFNKTGYHFNGWLCGGKKYFAGDVYDYTGDEPEVVFTAVWAKNYYQIEYSSEFHESTFRSTHNYNETGYTPTYCGTWEDVEGYELVGFVIAGVAYGLHDSFINLTANHREVLYATAIWEWVGVETYEETYLLLFDHNVPGDSSAYKTTTSALKGETVILQPSYYGGTGYVFEGWVYQDAFYPAGSEFIFTGEESACLLTAKWRPFAFQIVYYSESHEGQVTENYDFYANNRLRSEGANEWDTTGLTLVGWEINGALYSLSTRMAFPPSSSGEITDGEIFYAKAVWETTE